MRKKICSYAGCNVLIEYSKTNSRCSKHPSIPFINASRANQMLYQTPEWRRLRKEMLNDYPTCKICGGSNNLEVDHIVSPRGNESLFFDKDNLQVLCRDCHSNKTNIEIRNRRTAHWL